MKTTPKVNFISAHSVKNETTVGPAPVPTEVRIKSVDAIPNIGITIGDNNPTLPITVRVTLSNGLKPNYNVNWGNSTPPLNRNQVGEYIYTGTISTPPSILNPNNIKATVKVVVALPVPRTLVSAVNIPMISIEQGGTEPTLPSQVVFNISDGSTKTYPVTWGPSTPAFNANLLGTYEYKGTPSGFGAGISNPNNIKATIQVLITETGELTPRQEYINLNSANLGNNLFIGSHFSDELFPISLISSEGQNMFSILANRVGVTSLGDTVKFQGYSTGWQLVYKMDYNPNTFTVGWWMKLNREGSTGDFYDGVDGQTGLKLITNYGTVATITPTEEWAFYTHTFEITAGAGRYFRGFEFSNKGLKHKNSLELRLPHLNLGDTYTGPSFNNLVELQEKAKVEYPADDNILASIPAFSMTAPSGTTDPSTLIPETIPVTLKDGGVGALPIIINISSMTPAYTGAPGTHTLTARVYLKGGVVNPDNVPLEITVTLIQQ